MADTGSVAYVRPMALSTVAASGVTGSIAYTVPRAVNALWTQSGVAALANRKNTGVDLPSAIAPMGWVTVNGQRLPVMWDPVVYRFLRYLYEEKLGGIGGPTVPDVAATVTTTQAAASEASRQAQDLAVQTQANAEALFVVREVIRDNELDGAGQIPGVELR